MGNVLADVRHAARVLRKGPGFTLTAIAALALGIGANTAIFSVVNAVLLKPLPYPEPDRLVSVARLFRTGRGTSISVPKYTTWKRNAPCFEAMAAYDFGGPGLNLAGGDVPEQVNGIHASREYFDVFGANTALGRTFTVEEDQPGGPRVVVLSNGLWKRRLGGDRAILGRSITLSAEIYTVVGVLAPNFHPDPPADVWIPLQADPASTNQGHYLTVTGRLKRGVTLAQANAQLKAAGERFRAVNPDWMDKQETVGALPEQEVQVRNVRPALLVLAGAVALVLLIACANVANLLLARATGRQREIAIRAAIGAGRGRIVRQLLTESVLLAGVGGLVGLVLGSVGVRALLAITPGNVPRVDDLAKGSVFTGVLDWEVLAFTLGVSLLTGLLFGLAPALQISRTDLSSTLKESGSRSGTGTRHHRVQNILVISETAMALVLLVGAALLIRTFAGLRSVDPGIDPNHILTLQVSLAGQRYNTPEQLGRFETQVRQRLEALPGVTAATQTVLLPVSGNNIDLPFIIEGRPLQDKYHGDEYWRSIGPHYFDVFRIRLLRGRVFDERDNAKSQPVVIVDEAFARKYFPKDDAIGHQLNIGKGLGPEFDEQPRQIVGIVSDVREGGLDAEMRPVMYVPNAQISTGLLKFANQLIPWSWAIRTAGDPFALSRAVEREILAVDGQMAAAKINSMQKVLASGIARQDFNMLLLTIFAGIALLLAAIGLYGLMAYSVEQRAQEMGIRMALGAQSGDVLKMVMQHAMLLAGVGVAIGMAAAFGLARVLTSLLFGVKAQDPLIFAAVALVVTSVNLLASYGPARRATRVDPVNALKYA